MADTDSRAGLSYATREILDWLAATHAPHDAALAMARALPADGHLWTVEYDTKHARVARENLAAAGESARVTVLEGAGLDVLPTLDGLLLGVRR